MCLFEQTDRLKGELEMENVYVLAAYVAILVALIGCVLMKVGDILEQKRTQKYYRMFKDDAAFWQMKLEQTGMNIVDGTIDKTMDKMVEMTKKLAGLTDESDEPKEADEEFKKMFEGMEDDIVI